MLRFGKCILVGAILSGLFTDCGGPPAIDHYQIGWSTGYTPGVPSFDIEIVPSVPGHSAGLDLYLSVPSASLTFEKAGEQFWATDEVRVELHSTTDQALVLERTWRDTTAVPTYAATQRHDPFLIRRHIDVPPGEYTVEVTFENLGNQKSQVRRQFAGIPDSADQSPYIGKILVQARSSRGEMLPVVPFHVPSRLDSLQCATKLYNLNPARPSLATVDLVRYRSDTLPAVSPMSPTLLDLPMGYGVVTFEKPDTVTVFTRPIAAGTKEALLAIGLRGLPPGNYLAAFQVQTPAAGSASHDTLLREERFISICGPTFPRPSTLSELIGSMIYIARREEMKLLLEAPTPEIARTRFDSLWLSFRRDKKEAAALINRYYSRVEEANQRFTTTKEGWRTDRGMVYIVLGPPVAVANSKDQQVWYYDHRGAEALNVYTFQRGIVTNGRISLEKYTLFHQAYYEVFWARMVEKWRSGEVF